MRSLSEPVTGAQGICHAPKSLNPQAHSIQPGQTPRISKQNDRQALASRSSWHAGLLGAALNSAGFTEPIDRELLRALWVVSHGRPRFQASNQAIASECNRSTDWVGENLPLLIEHQANLELPLIVRVRRGQKGVSSEWDTQLLGAFLERFAARKPKPRERGEVGSTIAAELRQTPRAKSLMKTIERQIERRAERRAQAMPTAPANPYAYATGATARMLAKLRERIEGEGMTPADERAALLGAAHLLMARIEEIEQAADGQVTEAQTLSDSQTGKNPVCEPAAPGHMLKGSPGGGACCGPRRRSPRRCGRIRAGGVPLV